MNVEEAEARMRRWHRLARWHLNASLVAVTLFVFGLAVEFSDGPLLLAVALIAGGSVALVVALVLRSRMSAALSSVKGG